MEILKTLGGLALTAVAVVTIIGKASFFTASSMPHVKIEAADLPTRVVMTNMGIRLPDNRLEVFEEFKAAGHFAAFAYNPVENAYGYEIDMETPELARHVALKRCAFYSDDRSQCRIYAEIRPEGGVFPLDSRLGRWTELEFLNEYLPLTKTLGYSAFAAAPEGTYGYQANFPTKGLARKSALKSCESMVKEAQKKSYLPEEVPHFPPEAWVCKVLHTTGE